MSPTDLEIEQQIESARRQILEADCEEAQHAAWVLMKSLLCQRTPERVAQMEREQGLR